MEWQSGIDTIAHQATLEEKGKTIAVLGNGFNHIFPKENEELFKQIIKNGGLIVSEYAPNIKAKSENFLERNRIVSGISLGVLVIESAYRSGTSVTAKLAKKQGRNIFALPHEIYDIHGVGNNALIKEDIATIVCTTKDIIEEIGTLEYKEIPENKKVSLDINTDIYIRLNKRRKVKEHERKNKCTKEAHYGNEKTKIKESKERKRKVCENEKYNQVYKFITEETSTLTEIYRKASKNISISEINQILVMLEIEGYIEKVAGGYKCITTN